MTLFIFFVFFICDSAWIQSNKQLPTAKSSAAIGSYNNAVYILGGTSPGGNGMNIYRLIKYDTVTDQTTDDGNALNYGTFGISTYYTQIYHTLYIIQSGGANIWYYNLQNQISNAIPQNIPDTVHDCGCLASNDLQLFVVGGSSGSLSNMGSTLATMQVYDLSNSNWLNNVPSMQESRCSHSCIVDPIDNMLYVIGGFKIIDSSKDPPLVQYSATIDTIDTNNNIIDNSWSYIDALPIAIGWSSAVYFDDNIYIIGGAYGDYPWNGLTYVKSVYIIDTITETVSESSDSLNYRISNTVASVVNGIVYVFGGYDGLDTNKLMSYVLPTNSPSKIPTDNPSNIPSNEPSNTPSNKPSNEPSNTPSNKPSYSPSNEASNEPSYAPSNIPSNMPTINISITTLTILSSYTQSHTTFQQQTNVVTDATLSVISDILSTFADIQSTIDSHIAIVSGNNRLEFTPLAYIGIGVVLSIAVICICGFMVRFVWRLKQRKVAANRNKENMVDIDDREENAEENVIKNVKKIKKPMSGSVKITLKGGEIKDHHRDTHKRGEASLELEPNVMILKKQEIEGDAVATPSISSSSSSGMYYNENVKQETKETLTNDRITKKSDEVDMVRDTEETAADDV